MSEKQKTVYIADDGTEYDHELEMKYRDEEIKEEAEVQRWLEEIGAKRSTATRARKAIMEYFNWKRNHNLTNGVD